MLQFKYIHIYSQMEHYQINLLQNRNNAQKKKKKIGFKIQVCKIKKLNKTLYQKSKNEINL